MRYILQTLDVVCSTPSFLWQIELEYLALHIHTFAYSRCSWIILEVVQNQVKNPPIMFPNHIPSYIKCLTSHVNLRQTFFAVLPGSIAYRTCKSSIFLSIFIDIPRTIIPQDRRTMSYFGRRDALVRSALSFSSFKSTNSTNPDTAWFCPSSHITHTFIIILPLLIHHYPPTSIMPWKNSTKSTTDANVSETDRFLVPAYQPEPVFPVFNTTTLRSNLLFRLIALLEAKYQPFRGKWQPWRSS